MKTWITNYGNLLAEYSLYLKPGELVYVRAGMLAEPLVLEFYKKALQMGAWVEIEWSFEHEEDALLQWANASDLSRLKNNALDLISKCDAYLLIRAPYETSDLSTVSPERMQLRQKAHGAFSEIYFKRLGDGSLKRSLCQYPTPEAARIAGMSLEEYELFVRSACFLDRDDPAAEWKKLSEFQQGLVDYLNQCQDIVYEHKDWKISARINGRKWINSDGKSNMPSGEVFTSPLEDSVQGEIYFDYPTLMHSKELRGIRLLVKDGWIESWSAEQGQEVLDDVFAIEGTRRFGEIAIGTNTNIQRATKNILFDEKIGGTVHMAVGQSYIQCGGKNQSAVHWDLITDMKNGGRIFADEKLIYENGNFMI